MGTRSRLTKALLVITGLVMALGMTGCGKVTGDVVAKDFESGYYFTTYIPQYITTTSCSGNPSVCTSTQTFTGMLPLMMWMPDCYKLVVKPKDAKDNDTDSTCVSESVYNDTSIGDYYDGKKSSREAVEKKRPKGSTAPIKEDPNKVDPNKAPAAKS